MKSDYFALQRDINDHIYQIVAHFGVVASCILRANGVKLST